MQPCEGQVKHAALIWKRFHDAGDLEMNCIEIIEGKNNKMLNDEEPEALLRTALGLDR